MEAALAQRRVAETAAILAELSPLAEREADLRTRDEDMIFNRAFLVRRSQGPMFDATLREVGDRYGNRVQFRHVGPVPAYNFVDLHVNGLTEAA